MPRQIFLPSPRRSPSRAEPVTAHLRRPPPGGVVPPHRHPYGQLSCPLRGGIRLTAANTTWIVPTFRAVWIPPGIEHELVMLGHVEFQVAYVEPRATSSLPDKCCAVEVSSLLLDLIRALADVASGGRRRQRLVMELLLEELRQAPPLWLGLPLPSDRRLAALCRALMDDPASSRNLGEWSKSIGASERTVARLFRTELRTSFGAWRRQLRLSNAVDLIYRGMPLAEVAAQLGYAHPAAFSAMFRKAFGVPPSRIRFA
jgi:AraC-like DNA-binding protein